MSELPIFLSLGAGVQSSTLALLAAHGEIEMPTAAIFADTQAEPDSVYRWLDWLEKQLPFPVYRVTAGSLRDDALKIRTLSTGDSYCKTLLPMFTLSPENTAGKLRARTCTYDYKIRPITSKIRSLLGIKRGGRTVLARQYVGISIDEASRMKPARERWLFAEWPLIDLKMTRTSCKIWMNMHGYKEPPRSSCIFCPFHSDAHWSFMKKNTPIEFALAVEFERQKQRTRGLTSNFRSTEFLHRSCRPLDEVDFKSDVDRGQGLLWQNECTGMCGN